MVEPLSQGQKMFNQRLLAEHSLSEKTARKLWDRLAVEHDMGAESFEASIAGCNDQLQYAGLEIVGVAMPGEDGAVCHYAMINQFPDDMAKQVFQGQFGGAHQHSLVRLMLEKLVEGTFPRSTLLNLKNELDDPSKLSLHAAEETLEKLLDEKWLTETGRAGSNSAQIGLAPRAYLELSYLLVEEFGMDKDELPQQIYHRM